MMGATAMLGLGLIPGWDWDTVLTSCSGEGWAVGSYEPLGAGEWEGGLSTPLQRIWAFGWATAFSEKMSKGRMSLARWAWFLEGNGGRVGTEGV